MQGPWTAASVLAIAGVILGAVLMAAKVTGALFYSIVIIAIVGIPFGVTPMPDDFMLISMPQSMAPIALQLDFTAFLSFDINYYVVVFTMLFMDSSLKMRFIKFPYQRRNDVKVDSIRNPHKGMMVTENL